MKKLYICLLILVVLLLVSPASAWLTGYSYRKDVNISGYATNWGSPVNADIIFTNGTGAESGHTVYVNTSLANMSDIRITDTSDNLLPYWVEKIPGSEFVWTRFTYVAPGTHIYVYYKNATAASVSSGSQTFYGTYGIFDDFTGASLNATLWTSGGTVSQASGIVNISGEGGHITSTKSARASGFILFNASRGTTYHWAGYGSTPRFSKDYEAYNSFRYVQGGVGYDVADNSSTTAFTKNFIRIATTGTSAFWWVGSPLNSVTSPYTQWPRAAWPAVRCAPARCGAPGPGSPGRRRRTRRSGASRRRRW